MEIDVHTKGTTSTAALREAIALVAEAFKKHELKDTYYWNSAWVENCEISKLSCVPLVPIRYEAEEPEVVVPDTEEPKSTD